MRGSALLALCIVAASLTGSSGKNHGLNSHQLLNAVQKAESRCPSISSIEDEVELVQLASPSFRSVEANINKEYRQYSKVIDEMEYDRSHSYERSCQEELGRLNKAHKSLSRDLSKLHSAEVSNPTLALMQSSLQDVMSSDSQLMQALSFYIEASAPSFAANSEVIENANIDSPYAFTDVVDVLEVVSGDSAVSSALCGLSAQVHSLPKTVDSELIELISESSEVVGSVLSSLESCYPTAFSEATFIASFAKEHPTIETSLTSLLEVAQVVTGLTSAVSQVESDIAPSLVANSHAMTRVDKSWATASTALEFEQQLLDSSPTLDSAAHVVQSFFESSPTQALSLFYDVESPSIVTNPSEVEDEERSHPSFVSAVEYEQSWEDSHTRDAGFLEGLSSVVITALLQDSDLVSELSTMSYYDHPLTYSASVQVGLARSLVPSVTTVMSSIDQLIKSSQSVSCAETLVASYVASQPSVVIEIWQGLTDTESITDVSAFAYLTAQYPALMSAFDTLLDAEKSSSTLEYYQTQLLDIEESDSSFISQWSIYTEASYSLSDLLSDNGVYESSSSFSYSAAFASFSAEYSSESSAAGYSLFSDSASFADSGYSSLSSLSASASLSFGSLLDASDSSFASSGASASLSGFASYSSGASSGASASLSGFASYSSGASSGASASLSSFASYSSGASSGASASLSGFASYSSGASASASASLSGYASSSSVASSGASASDYAAYSSGVSASASASDYY